MAYKRRNIKNHYRNTDRQKSPRRPNIKSKRPSHVTTYVKENEHPDRAIKRFLKKCKKEKVIEHFRKYDYFEKPSLKRHRAKVRRKALIKKANQENKEV
tara:strand:- start:39 stop:335 length:297 start_codon:yes stop_codon:yes gene_type:complete